MLTILAEAGEKQVGWGNPIGIVVGVALFFAFRYAWLRWGDKIENPSPPPPLEIGPAEKPQVDEFSDEQDQDPEGVVDHGRYRISYEVGNHTKVNVTRKPAEEPAKTVAKWWRR